MAEEIDPRQAVGRLTLVDSGPIAPAEPIMTEEPESEPTRPPNIQSVYLGGLFLLALLAACYAAAEILLPIVVAFVLMLVLQPAMRLLGRLHLPRGLAALLLSKRGRTSEFRRRNEPGSCQGSDRGCA
jgi:hypothetical protein